MAWQSAPSVQKAPKHFLVILTFPFNFLWSIVNSVQDLGMSPSFSLSQPSLLNWVIYGRARRNSGIYWICILWLFLPRPHDYHHHQKKKKKSFQVMSNLDSIFKSRDITLPTKIRLVKAMVFPVVMYGCESWTVKKAERWRIDAFELWCWRRLLRVPWTARRSNQSILKEISPGISVEGMMLKLKL